MIKVFTTNFLDKTKSYEKVILGIAPSNDLTTYRDFRNILTDKKDMQYLPEAGIRPNLTCTDDNILYVKAEDGNTIDMTPMTSYFTKFFLQKYKEDFTEKDIKELCDVIAEGILSSIRKVPETLNTFCGEEGVKTLLKSFYHMLKYFNKEEIYALDVDDVYFDNNNYSKIVELVMENKQQSGFSSTQGGSKESTQQSEATDKIYIAIPHLANISTCSPLSLVPRLTQIFKPYSNALLHYPNWQNIKAKFGIDIDDDDILGHIENNDLNIQSNEVEYYNDLCNLIKAGLEQIRPGEDVEALFKTGVYNEDVREYLKALLSRVLSYNWSHTGCVPMLSDIENLDDDSEDLEDIQEEREGDDRGSKSFMSSATGNNIDGYEKITKILDKASELNPYAYAEAIIKLLRWGSRKPSHLFVDGMDTNLDLNSFSNKSFIGNYNSLEVKYIDGCEFSLLGFVTCNDTIKDSLYRQRVGFNSPTLEGVIGFKLVKAYENGAIRYVYMSTIDFVASYLRGKPISISGIKFDPKEGFELDDKIVIKSLNMPLSDNKESLDTVFSNIAKDKNMYIEYQSDTLMELLLTYKIKTSVSLLNCYRMLCNVTNINSIYAECRFDDYGSYKDISAKNDFNDDAYVSATLLERLIPTLKIMFNTYDDLLMKGEDLSNKDYLDIAFMSAQRSKFIADYGDLLHTETAMTTDNTATEQKMNMFKEEKQVQQTSNGQPQEKPVEEKPVEEKPVQQTPNLPLEEKQAQQTPNLPLEENVKQPTGMSEKEAVLKSIILSNQTTNDFVTKKLIDIWNSSYEQIPGIKKYTAGGVDYAHIANLEKGSNFFRITKDLNVPTQGAILLDAIIPTILRSLLYVVTDQKPSLYFESIACLEFMHQVTVKHCAVLKSTMLDRIEKPKETPNV